MKILAIVHQSNVKCWELANANLVEKANRKTYNYLVCIKRIKTFLNRNLGFHDYFLYSAERTNVLPELFSFWPHLIVAKKCNKCKYEQKRIQKQKVNLQTKLNATNRMPCWQYVNGQKTHDIRVLSMPKRLQKPFSIGL